MREKWQKSGLVADGPEKRRIIGERIVKAIRFPIVEQEEFASVVLDSKILSIDEVANIIKCFSSGPSFFCGFSSDQEIPSFTKPNTLLHV